MPTDVPRSGFLLHEASISGFAVTFVDLFYLKNKIKKKKNCKTLKTKATVAVFARLKASYLKRVMKTKINIEYKV